MQRLSLISTKYSSAKFSSLLPWLVAGTFFMELLDGTVIATALPQMGMSFGVGATNMSIGMTSYLLTLAVFIPVSGWLAERFGARIVFASAISLFTVASLMCGSSLTLAEFVLARVVQGVGGAMMVPVGRMVILRTTARQDLVRAINTITWPGLIAPVIGPAIGGFLTTFVSWRWIFWLNLPLGAIAGLLALWIVPGGRGVERPFDRLGFVLSGASLAGMMFGLDQLGSSGTAPALSLGLLAGSGVIGFGALLHARRNPYPMLDLTPSSIPTMALNIYAGSLFRTAFNTFPYLVPLFLQIGFGMSAFRAGMLILVSAVGDLAIKSALPWLYRAYGFRKILVVTAPVGALGFLAIAALSPKTPSAVIALVLLSYGVTRSLQFGALNTLSFADIPPAQASAASTLVSALVQLNTGMGIAFGAVTLHAAASLIGGNPGRPNLTDFRCALVCAGVVAGSAWFLYRRLPLTIGDAVSGHAPRPDP